MGFACRILDVGDLGLCSCFPEGMPQDFGQEAKALMSTSAFLEGCLNVSTRHPTVLEQITQESAEGKQQSPWPHRLCLLSVVEVYERKWVPKEGYPKKGLLRV